MKFLIVNIKKVKFLLRKLESFFNIFIVVSKKVDQ